MEMISDDTVFLQHVLHCLKTKLSTITSVDTFSDGPTIKQRFLFSNLHYWEQANEISINVLQNLTERVLLMELEGQSREQRGETLKSHITTANEYAALAKAIISMFLVSRHIVEQKLMRTGGEY